MGRLGGRDSGLAKPCADHARRSAKAPLSTWYNSLGCRVRQVRGAVYDLYSAEIEWLGQHPELDKIVGRPLAIHRWKTSPYISPPVNGANPGRSPEARAIIAELMQGNGRFLEDRSEVGNVRSSWCGERGVTEGEAVARAMARARWW